MHNPDPLSRVPKQLRVILQSRGYCLIKDVAPAIGSSYPTLMNRCAKGEVPVLNVAPKDAKRAQWRFFEPHLIEFFAGGSPGESN